MSGRVVIVSGYFNPIHSGHIDYLESAKEIGDYLIVIVNNDKQVELKGSVPFMDEEERVKIVSSLRCVDRAVVSIDDDPTVCQSIKKEYHRLQDDPFFIGMAFANGGDRKKGGVPEDVLEEELGINMVYNVGGKKTQSSSRLIQTSKIRNV
ncbi:adenylyltransferase/cytidyltransferase family protein [Ulvibacter sp.]|jgi:cytidyltransferase-like protein|nr:adenylyltransferase/cytidyltransferase family protein [Ulvibacter sp.]|tara:strand:+ start:523 stop:975 length:453 start_codon:yes stop_codon:yes gene_type:complete